jgi:Ni/Co efflux regulator RcnB
MKKIVAAVVFAAFTFGTVAAFADATTTTKTKAKKTKAKAKKTTEEKM